MRISTINALKHRYWSFSAAFWRVRVRDGKATGVKDLEGRS